MEKITKRILVFGAGVIGLTFGGRMTLQEYDVTFLARNKRFAELKEIRD